MADLQTKKAAIKTAVAAALVITCMQKARATMNEATTYVTSPCLENLFDETLASRYDSEIQRRQQNIESNYKTIRSWHFLTEKTGDVKRQAGFKALVVYGLRTNNAAAQTYEQNKPALETAAAALRQLAANMSTAMQLQKVTEVTAYGTIEAGTTGHAPSSTGSCKYTGITAKTTTQKCTPDQEAKQKININTVAKGKLNQLQLVDDSYLTTLTLDATAGTKGTPNAASNTYDHGDCQSSSPAANFGGNNALGLKITKLGTSETTTTQTITKTGAGCPNKSQTESTTAAQRLAYLVCEAEEAKLPDVPLLSDVKLEDISGDASILAALSAMLLPGKGGADEFSEQHKNELKKIINQVYGANDQAFQATYIKPLTEDIKFKFNGIDVAGTVIDVMAGTQGPFAIAYYAGKNIPKQKSETNTPLVESKKGTECELIADKEKCKTADECELKGEKCVAKTTIEGVVTGSQNTTESNSFVIHKAPLSLAFLILA
uniref:Variant surface glycoprotein 1125.1695 n=1 Tax=Trypanosoma brucei TaxID=5691 RepID=A0A1J0R7J7_9TRYP|nr:variant surface glycoprotein 1125.1695 [Trypanosoma brucei]